jgi:hypothetical protein
VWQIQYDNVWEKIVLTAEKCRKSIGLNDTCSYIPYMSHHTWSKALPPELIFWGIIEPNLDKKKEKTLGFLLFKIKIKN